jgi:hypothetical protein
MSKENKYRRCPFCVDAKGEHLLLSKKGKWFYCEGEIVAVNKWFKDAKVHKKCNYRIKRGDALIDRR